MLEKREKKEAEDKRIKDLGKEGKLIEGTKEKTAEATAETEVKKVTEKIKKEIDVKDKDIKEISNEMKEQTQASIYKIQSILKKHNKEEGKAYLIGLKNQISKMIDNY